MFEQTHVTLLTCEAKLADLEADLKKDNNGVDCSKVPSSRDCEKTFLTKA